MLGSFNGFMFGSVFDRQGVSGSGNRRIGCTMYDNTRNDELRRLGCVEGNIVKHSLKGEDIPDDMIDDMIEEAYDRWPKPWIYVMVHAIKTRSLNGIPIKEYMPDRLVNGRIALLGDAAHAPAPITAGGFNASLEDAVSLGKSAAKGVQGQVAIDALQTYEVARLKTVRSMVSSGESFSMSFGRP